MRPLDLFSEAFHPTGGLASEGVQNQLGRPHLDRLSLLVREAVQNSWDARAGDAVVEFGLSCWALTHRQRSAMQEVLFRSEPPGIELRRHMAADSDFYVLGVWDRGTVGLEGPTRADIVTQPGERTDFVDFMHNIGQPPERRFGGGTYGFGKTAYFLASRLRTICVHTRCQSGQTVETRLMAAALGAQYTIRQGATAGRYTGRHWWGRAVHDQVVEPLTGAEAESLADALGLPAFGPQQRGTTVLVLMPTFGEDQPLKSLRLMRDTILRYFWPKMVDGSSGGGTMKFRLSLNGNELPVPDPHGVRPLHLFAQAFEALQRNGSGAPSQLPDARVLDVASYRPARRLGVLSLVRVPTAQSRPVEASVEVPGQEGFQSGREDVLSASPSHIALMRAPNFVVRYEAGPPAPYEQAEYGGVFRVERDLDATFARAEPPTHDDWVPDCLEDPNERTYVRVALRRIREVLREFAAPPAQRPAEGLTVPLGAFSDMLGGLVPGEVGPGATTPQAGGVSPGAGRTGGGGGGGHRGRVAQIRVSGKSSIELMGGRPTLLVPFEIEHVGSEAAIVTAEADVVVEGGAFEDEPPTGSDRPRVLEWRGPRGKVVEGAQPCTIPPELAGAWVVAVSMPHDAMVAVSLRVEHEAKA